MVFFPLEAEKGLEWTFYKTKGKKFETFNVLLP